MIEAAPIALPLGFDDWWPATQAATIALLTFVQEDAPTISAAVLAVAGRLNTATGFLGCFFGIWIGDALLYLLARFGGRTVLEHSWAKRFVNQAAIARSERWFAQRGSWLVVSSRVIPGMRLPTYLAAGFLRIPLSKFLLLTGVAVALWTMAIFVLAQSFGSELLGLIQQWRGSIWMFAATVVLLVASLRLALHLGNAQSRRRVATALIRWTRWEFWPAWLFYAPVFVNYLCLAIRHRGFTLPTVANPGIFSGGIVGESKIATLQELSSTSPEFTAEAHLLEGTSQARRDALQGLLAGKRIAYPFILKPDVGQRGAGVKLIRNSRQACDYLDNMEAPLICQSYAPGPNEIGVFYYRFPNESHGHVFAITEKVFPQIIGDGVRNIEELIWADSRARFIAEKYLVRLNGRGNQVLPRGETLKLVEAGNHAQGCIFRDGMHLLSEALEQRIEEISQKLNGFFIGRYDIRYASEAELRAGRSFQIIELNGAASEATSIYDARNSLWSVYRTLFRQWELVFSIGAENRRRGTLPTSLHLLWRSWRETAALVQTYPIAD